MLKKAWTGARDQLDHLDVLIAAALGLLFTVLGLIDEANGDALAQAAIALLALLAFSVLRDRRAREDLEDAIEAVKSGLASVRDGFTKTVNDVESTVNRTLAEMAADYPYHTRRLVLEWDLVAPDGTLAIATKKRSVRFTRNNVVSVNEHHKADGSVEEYSIEGGVQNQLEPLSTFPEPLIDDRGRPIVLVALRRPYKLGECMEIVSHRKLKNSFTKTTEYVNLEVESPTEEVEFRLIWPAGSNPREVRLTRERGRSHGAPIAAERLESQPDGRIQLSHTVADPQIGESLTIVWEWTLQRAP
jgi:hypothetical protein